MEVKDIEAMNLPRLQSVEIGFSHTGGGVSEIRSGYFLGIEIEHRSYHPIPTPVVEIAYELDHNRTPVLRSAGFYNPYNIAYITPLFSEGDMRLELERMNLQIVTRPPPV